MILQALYQLAEIESLLDDPDYEWKPLAWLVTIGDGGKLLGIQGTHTTPAAEAGKKKPKSLPKSFAVPREPGRTSGDRAFFLYDKSEYALGLDTETDLAKKRPADKLAARLALFRERAEECLAATGDDGVRAVCAFLARLQSGEAAVTLPAECAPNDLFGFIYQKDVDRLVTDRPAVREYWRSLRAAAEEGGGERVLCLVSGQLAPAVDKLPLLKNVPGGSSSGVALVSFNSNAFESYGWSGNENAQISRGAAEACSTALNRLLHPAFPNPKQAGQTLAKRNLRLSDDTAVCFWASTPAGDDFASQVLGLLDSDPEEVREMYRSVWKGVPHPIDDPSLFYALTLSGSQGRAIVRDWFEATVKTVDENLAQHFRDLAIVRNTPPPKGRELPPALPFRVLLRSLSVRGEEKGVPASLAGQIVHAALAKVSYPFSVLQRALERTRAEIGRTEWSDKERHDARAALLKAVLNRRLRFHQATTNYPEITEAMDPNNHAIGYQLGRLMAFLERMQQLALKDVNASVVDRYFSAASATPQLVFRRLMKGYRHHVRKAEDDREAAEFAGSIDRRVDETISKIHEQHTDFPPFLPLEQQGLFIIGFHHQRHLLSREYWARHKGAQHAAEPIEA